MTDITPEMDADGFEDLMVFASGEILTEFLPKDFGKMSEGELDAFLKETATERYEYDSPGDIYEAIDDLARHTKRLMQTANVWDDYCRYVTARDRDR